MQKKMHFTLKFSLISVLIFIFVAFLSGLLLLFFMKSQAALKHTSDKIMDEVTTTVNFKVKNLIQPIDQQIGLTQSLLKSEILKSNDASLEQYSYQVLKLMPQVKMVYFARPDGSFIISRRQKGQINSEVINKNKKTRVITRTKGGIETTTTGVSSYNPLVRPWYENAMKNSAAVWSKPYVFTTGKVYGITRSLSVNLATASDAKNKIVIGVDMTLKSLSDFVAELKPTKNGMVIITDSDGKVLASPGLTSILNKLKQEKMISYEQLNDKLVTAVMNNFYKSKQDLIHQEVDGAEYLASFSPVVGFDNQVWRVAIISPVEDFVGLQKEKLFESMIWGLAIMLVCVIFIWIFGNRFSKSIYDLSLQMDKVSNLDLDFERTKKSRITEVMRIQRSLDQVKHGLRSFEKYVPAKLVKQLIVEEKSATLGGEKIELVIFFSDIKDFTSISENMPPTPLLEHMCEYFEVMTHTIWDHKGTIDKFIGDSVMAFWGAPSEDDSKVLHACQTALAIQNDLQTMNAQWQAAGKAALPTRIGLHIGDVIVGNVGSSDRINYTTLGDAVNLASRLEAIGKVYFCDIVVSKSIYEQASEHFVFCPLDVLAVKGKQRPVKIYELISAIGDKHEIDYNQYAVDFERAFALYAQADFTAALAEFKLMRDKYSRKVIDLYIERCEFLQENKPANWDGVWRYTTK